MIGSEDRDVLTDQVRYLVDELDAQKAIVSFVPDPLWSATLPTGEHSLLELYGLLVGLSESGYPALLSAWSDGTPDEVRSVDEDVLRDAEAWNEADPLELIDRAAVARRALVVRLEALPDTAWDTTRTVDGVEATVADLAFRVTQEDATILRVIGERLHEANLGATPIKRQ